jgi:hypothetical protein
LNGYRVRLRVVEEYDVALLAESPDDAKARAEADLRRREQFEDIQDSWPEQIVSVEALAVEPVGCTYSILLQIGRIRRLSLCIHTARGCRTTLAG